MPELRHSPIEPRYSKPEFRHNYLESKYSKPELPIHLVLSVKKPAPAYVCVGRLQNEGNRAFLRGVSGIKYYGITISEPDY